MPLTISRLSDDLRRAPGRRRRCQRLPAGGFFRLGLDDVQWGQCADLDAGAIVLDELRGQLQRALGDFDRLDGADEIQYAVLTAATVRTIVPRSATSEICWLICVTFSAARVPSMRKLRSSG